eukprot:GHVS01004825.1.p2 GENE.GHVS01004825.1~~GHVS01004825.1.p2  ORF type:complete len:460 (+),score=95.34 GHVS01004825.1:1527-2906(+)
MISATIWTTGVVIVIVVIVIVIVVVVVMANSPTSSKGGNNGSTDDVKGGGESEGKKKRSDNNTKSCGSGWLTSTSISWSTKRNILRGAGIVVVLAGLLQVLFLVMNAVRGGFSLIDVKDKATLKSVFFGGEPWLLHCLYPSPQAKPSSLTKLNGVVESNRMLLRSLARLGTIDCTVPLPSGKTVLERFGLLGGTVGFVIANGDKPKALSSWALQDGSHLYDFVKSNVKPFVYAVSNNKELHSKCTRADSCVVFGQKGGLGGQFRHQYISSMLESRRLLKAVHVDTTKYIVALDDQLASTRVPSTVESKDPSIDVFCLARVHTADTESSKTQTSSNKPPLPRAEDYVGRFFAGDVRDGAQLGAFFDSCVSAPRDIPTSAARLTRLPKLSTRHGSPPPVDATRRPADFTSSSTASSPSSSAGQQRSTSAGDTTEDNGKHKTADTTERSWGLEEEDIEEIEI